MPTDGDKIVAATLAAKLMEIVSGASTDEGKIDKAFELYETMLRRVADSERRPSG
jgi:hypothetical protein